MDICQKSGNMCCPIRKGAPREWSRSSHKKDEDKASGSPSNSISSDEEGLGGGSQRTRKDDPEWSGSGSNELSQDVSDQDSE